MSKPLITCQEWHDENDYKQAWAPTNDPRIVAVIERDEEASFSVNLDGDAILPVFLVERGSVDHAGGYEGDSSSIASRIVEARDRFRYAAGYRYNGLRSDVMVKADEMTARWAWIFHGTTFHRGGYGYNHDYDVLVLNTPEFREHVGVGEFEAVKTQSNEEVRAEAQEWADGMSSEVSAIADGEVYGIGYAVIAERVTEEEPFDFDAAEVNIEVWGFVGEDYAKREAGDFSAGSPELPLLLDFAA